MNVKIVIKLGCINRLRYRQLGSTAVVAAWAEQGSVSIWSLDKSLQKLEEPVFIKPGDKENQWPREESMPLFKFSGHATEGFALNWSDASPGLLATGDCAKNIYTWKPTDDGSWGVDSRYNEITLNSIYIEIHIMKTLAKTLIS